MIGKWYARPLDETGGYDGMTAGIDIFHGGERIFTIDLGNLGQGYWQDLPAELVVKAEAVRDRILSAVNAWDDRETLLARAEELREKT